MPLIVFNYNILLVNSKIFHSFVFVYSIQFMLKSGLFIQQMFTKLLMNTVSESVSKPSFLTVHQHNYSRLYSAIHKNYTCIYTVRQKNCTLVRFAIT